MKRKIIEKFVATAKQSAQQLIEEFTKQLSTLKGKSTSSQSVSLCRRMWCETQSVL